jgi:hypothetical protein
VEYETVREQQKTANHVSFLGFKLCQEDSSYVEMKKVRNEVISYVTFIRVLMVREDKKHDISENINYGIILEHFLYICLFTRQSWLTESHKV